MSKTNRKQKQQAAEYLGDEKAYEQLKAVYDMKIYMPPETFARFVKLRHQFEQHKKETRRAYVD